MRKSYVLGLGLALSLGAAGAASAQSTTPQRPERPKAGEQRGWERGEGRGRRGGPEGLLLKGITLSDAQKAKLQELRKSQRDEMKNSREANRSTFEAARAARQKGDTAAARAAFEQIRAQGEAQRAKHVAALRSVLTADQQKQLDANLAELKARQADRGEGRAFGPRGGRGHGQHQR
jgi:Spy/CpxP family protein refolding chaperone